VSDQPRRSTWRELVEDAARSLSTAGVGSPVVDAELLAAHAAGIDRSRLRSALLTGTAAEPTAARWFETAITRRAGR
jgi:release factor glutamine methyltransferase